MNTTPHRMHTVVREELTQRILQSCARGVTAIVAPAGFGKTIAVRHVLERLEAPHVYLALGEEHRTLLGFSRGFAAALAAVNPDARALVADAYASARSAAAPAEVLAHWLLEQFPDHTVVIVIDDVHLVHADTEIEAFLQTLISHTSARARWLIASREVPPFPVDSIVTADDVRFGERDLHDFASLCGVSLDEQITTDLVTAMSGWPAILCLSLRMASHSGDVREALSNAKLLSYDFLLHEFYAKCSPGEQTLLMYAALFVTFDASTLLACGHTNSSDFLEYLTQHRGLLAIVTAEDGEPRYRCHDLFRDFLRYRFTLLPRQTQHDLRLRAADALYERGRIARATLLYIEARDDMRLLQVLEEHGFDLLARAHEDSVASALDALSSRGHAASPVVTALRGMLALRASQQQHAIDLLEAALASGLRGRFRLRAASFCAAAMIVLRKDARLLLQDMLATDDLAAGERAIFLALLAVACVRYVSKAEVLSIIADAEPLTEHIESPEERGRALNHLGIATKFCDGKKRAATYFSRALEIATEHRLYGLQSYLFINLAWCWQLDLSIERRYHELAEEAARKAGQLGYRRRAFVSQIRVAYCMGETDTVQRLLDEHAALPGSDDDVATPVVTNGRRLLAVWQWRLDDALTYAMKARTQSFHPTDRPYHEAFYALVLALRGEQTEALRVAQAIGLPEFPDPEDDFTRALVTALHAIVEALGGRTRAACARLERFSGATDLSHATIVGAYALVQALSGEGSLDAVARAGNLLREHSFGGYALLFETIAFRIAAHPRSTTLSEHEAAIFRLLARGYRPKEIAQQTETSLHTVRWHIARAIRKLGHTKAEVAVRDAIARGLL